MKSSFENKNQIVVGICMLVNFSEDTEKKVTQFE